jgi:hypothetical protein
VSLKDGLCKVHTCVFFKFFASFECFLKSLSRIEQWLLVFVGVEIMDGFFVLADKIQEGNQSALNPTNFGYSQQYAQTDVCIQLTN